MADIIKNSFLESNEHAKVIFQRGRDVLDYELNEAQDIERVRQARLGLAVAGEGAPDGGLKVTANASGSTAILKIAKTPIAFLVDGIPLRLEADDITSLNLPVNSGGSPVTEKIYMQVSEVEIADPAQTAELGGTTKRTKYAVTFGHTLSTIPADTTAHLWEGGTRYRQIATVVRPPSQVFVNSADIKDTRPILPSFTQSAAIQSNGVAKVTNAGDLHVQGILTADSLVYGDISCLTLEVANLASFSGGASFTGGVNSFVGNSGVSSFLGIGSDPITTLKLGAGLKSQGGTGASQGAVLVGTGGQSGLMTFGDTSGPGAVSFAGNYDFGIQGSPGIPNQATYIPLGFAIAHVGHSAYGALAGPGYFGMGGKTGPGGWFLGDQFIYYSDTSGAPFSPGDVVTGATSGSSATVVSDSRPSGSSGTFGRLLITGISVGSNFFKMGEILSNGPKSVTLATFSGSFSGDPIPGGAGVVGYGFAGPGGRFSNLCNTQLESNWSTLFLGEATGLEAIQAYASGTGNAIVARAAGTGFSIAGLGNAFFDSHVTIGNGVAVNAGDVSIPAGGVSALYDLNAGRDLSAGRDVKAPSGEVHSSTGKFDYGIKVGSSGGAGYISSILSGSLTGFSQGTPLPANVTTDICNVTVTGALPGDKVMLGWIRNSGFLGGLVFTGNVTATNVVTITAANVNVSASSVFNVDFHVSTIHS